MKKIILIGWKDLILAFRDRAGLILMLVAPFALTLGLGFVTGRFSGGSSSGISNIPVVLVNQDDGQLGKSLVGLFQSNNLGGLMKPTLITDLSLAQRQVDEDQAAAAIIIPAGFSQSILSPQGIAPADTVVQIKLYTNPTQPTSVGVVKSILDEYISRLEVGRVGGQVAVMQLVSHGLIQAQEADQIGSKIGFQQAETVSYNTSITLKNVTSSGEAVKFDVLAYIAPGMALMFLMYTVSYGGRTLLAERAQGTLPRLLVTPSSSTQVLGGKVFGIYLTGVAQMLILIVTSTLLFQLKWGNPLAVLVLVLAAVAGAVGWGLLITAMAKNPGQVAAIGAAIMLTFGILGGSFISLTNMPAWFQTVSKITPNAWGLDGFTTLASGGSLATITSPVLALVAMAAILFTLAALLINRRGFSQ